MDIEESGPENVFDQRKARRTPDSFHSYKVDRKSHQVKLGSSQNSNRDSSDNYSNALFRHSTSDVSTNNPSQKSTSNRVIQKPYNGLSSNANILDSSQSNGNASFHLNGIPMKTNNTIPSQNFSGALNGVTESEKTIGVKMDNENNTKIQRE